jgi:hypothetical protein
MKRFPAMKRFLLIPAVATGLWLVALPLHSQAPAPAPAIPAIPAGTPLQQLRMIRDQNVKLLEQQAATLLKLEELEKAAEQLKIFAKRS